MSGVNGMVVERFVPRARRFPAHSHDEFVISANGVDVLRERVRLGRRRFDVGPDEVTVYNPGEVQSSSTDTREGAPWECFSIHVDAATVAELTGREAIEAECPVIHDRGLAELIRQTARLSDPQAAAESTMWAISAALCRNGGSGVGAQMADTPTAVGGLAPVLDRMRDDLASPVSVPELAASVSLSPDYFIRAFVKHTGVPPYTWQLQLRVREGRRRLRAGQAPSTVAADLGFSDQAHFHRHFVAAYASTPGRFGRASRRSGIVQD